MVMVHIDGNQDQYMLANFLMERSMAKVNGKKMIKIKNLISTLVIMSWTKNTGKDSLTGRVEIIILEDIKMI